ncbi:MAG: acetyl-CoA C-acyltransferase, partial [Pseudomonadales bacterium]|nr:acetyl-CoA C-acyltransferase [Pseudomonadales bacterium]
MKDVVIVDSIRTGLAKSFRGSFNLTRSDDMLAHCIDALLERNPKMSPDEVEDVVVGSASHAGEQDGNLARLAVILSKLPVTSAGMTINRFCSSGLQTIALAAQRVIAGEGDIFVAGGVESISCVQGVMNQTMLGDPWLAQHKPELYWPMLQTAELVAKRYAIDKERQDQYGVRSQQAAAAAQAAGLFDAEIVPMTVTMGVADKASGQLLSREVTIAADEGIRPDTTLEGVRGIRSAVPGG